MCNYEFASVAQCWEQSRAVINAETALVAVKVDSKVSPGQKDLDSCLHVFLKAESIPKLVFSQCLSEACSYQERHAVLCMEAALSSSRSWWFSRLGMVIHKPGGK